MTDYYKKTSFIWRNTVLLHFNFRFLSFPEERIVVQSTDCSVEAPTLVTVPQQSKGVTKELYGKTSFDNRNTSIVWY